MPNLVPDRSPARGVPAGAPGACRLLLVREPTTARATLGNLLVNGEWQCWTLEDVDREPRITTVRIADWKVPGATAIPIGTYALELTHSPKFGRRLPLVRGVPGFEGIRIHPGNTEADTEGCILPGLLRFPDRVAQSRMAYDRLLHRLKREWARGITLTIVRALDLP